MAFGDAELRVMFRHMGDPVSCGGSATYPDGEPIRAFVENTAGDGVIGSARVSDVLIRAELPYNAFPTAALRAHAQFEVLGGRNVGTYEIRSVDPLEDGATLELKLRKL